MSVRDRFDVYVLGLTQSDVARRELRRLADALCREAAEHAVRRHPFHNDKGGNAVCTVCWKGREEHG